MFERYTEKARRVIFFARYEASQFGSPYIESEHLLLALFRENKTVSARLFPNSPESIDNIRKQIEAQTTFRKKISTSIDLPVSNECKRIMTYAAEEAEGLGHKHIGTEHLLLGMLREKECYAAHLLNESGIALENARARIFGGPRVTVAPLPKSPGIPAGCLWQHLLYNPASESIIVEMKCVAERPLPPVGRIFSRHKSLEAYEQVGNPPDDVSYQNPVTCAKEPILIFNSLKWNKTSGVGSWDGVYAFNLGAKELTVCVPKDKLSIQKSHVRSWISTLISLSDDGQILYVNVGIENAVPGGAVVDYYLASLDLAENKLELLSQLKDLRF